MSEKQRKYLWKFKPEIAKKWDKEYGSKPMIKTKSRLKRIKLIIAQSVPSSVVPNQTAQTGVQSSNIDLNSLVNMVPNIMGQIDSSDLNQVKQHLITNMKIDPQLAEKATTQFGIKIYQQEKLKRQHQVVMDVAKKMGIDPEKVKNWDRVSTPEALSPLTPIGTSMLNRAIRLGKIYNTSIYKKSESESELDLDSIVQKVNNMSISDKIKNLYRFFSGFNSIADGVDFLMNKMKQIESNIQANSSLPKTAQMSKRIGNVAAILWVVSFVLMLSATGESDFNARYRYQNIDTANEIRLTWMALSSVGASLIATALASFFNKKEEKKKKKRRFYQGDL